MRDFFWFGIGAAALLGLSAALEKDRRAFAQTSLFHHQESFPNPAPVSAPSFGLEVDDQGVYVQDIGAWISAAPQAFEDAIRDGALGAQGVLVHVLRRALPRYRWPPDASSPHYPQFAAMVKKVAEDLHYDPEPEPKTRLSVVE